MEFWLHKHDTIQEFLHHIILVLFIGRSDSLRFSFRLPVDCGLGILLFPIMLLDMSTPYIKAQFQNALILHMPEILGPSSSYTALFLSLLLSAHPLIVVYDLRDIECHARM